MDRLNKAIKPTRMKPITEYDRPNLQTLNRLITRNDQAKYLGFRVNMHNHTAPLMIIHNPQTIAYKQNNQRSFDVEAFKD